MLVAGTDQEVAQPLQTVRGGRDSPRKLLIRKGLSSTCTSKGCQLARVM